ncbi:MAG: TIGR03545 family protein [bacterium]|nr:TIGR03545 family protein [bacterium]
MRIKGLLFVLIVAGLFFGIPFLIPDGYVEEKIETRLSIANTAKVEFEDFKLSLVDLELSWSRLQVTDPDNTMMNLFETGEVELDFEFWPVLWEQVIIEDVRMTGFALETERETDGAFEIPEGYDPETGVPEDAGFFYNITNQVTSTIAENARMEFTDVKDDINVDSLLATINLQSIDKMEGLKNGLESNYSKWDSTITNNSIEKNAREIENLVKSIKLDEIKDVPAALKAIETVQRVVKEADSLKNEINTLQTDFRADIQNSRNSIGQIDEWISEDVDRVKNVAKLPEINAQSIGTALFGQNLLADLNTYLEYFAMGREYGQKFIGSDEKDEKPERYEGVNYEFTDKYDLPKLWIKNIELSGVTKNNIELAGQVLNVTNNQNKTGSPITFQLSGAEEGVATLTVDGALNYLGEEKSESLSINYSGFSLVNSKISPSELLPYDLRSGKGDINVDLTIKNRRIESRVDYVADNIAFDFESAGRPKGTVERLIRDAISGTNRITATALIDNTEGPLRARVRSNVDDLFLNALKRTVQAEVDNAKRRIENEVNTRVTAKKKEVQTLVEEQEQILRNKYAELETKVNEQLAIVEKKKEELEEKKKELEEELKNKALDAVKKKIGF